jgi:type II secretory pathway pseudopilin PulG
MAKLILAVIAIIIVIAAVAGGGGNNASQESPDSEDSNTQARATLNENTRSYLNKMNTCELSVGIVLLAARDATSDLALSADTTEARDYCEETRAELLDIDTDGFEDAADTGWYGVDRWKSGLNAMLAYIDDPIPSKLIEARDKLQEGGRHARQARREINAVRREHNLQPYRP